MTAATGGGAEAGRGAEAVGGAQAVGGAEADCVFCQVVRGELPAHVVVADEACVAFLDHSPAARGHTLVVPRRHAEHLWDVDEQSAAAVMRTAHAAARVLRERLAPDGLTLRQNTGRASGQDVPHLHLHLVPRWHGDGTIGWPRPPVDRIDLTTLLVELTGPASHAPGAPG